jgi:tape measure domain-containing protein
MSSQPSLVIRIGADASGAINNIRNLNQTISQTGTITNNTSNHVSNITQNINSTGDAARRAAGAFSGLSSALTSLAGAFGLHEIIKQMDAWSSMEGRLRLVTQSTNELQKAQEGLSKVAQTTRTDLEATTNLYFKMAQATKEAGKSQTELLRLTETTNKAIIISGSGTIEAKNALIQFGQALGSNRLGGDELRSMAEQTPHLVTAIRDGLGVTTAEFKKMAEAGALTTDVVMGSLSKMSGKIDKEFGMMPVTIGQSFTLLGNAMTEFIGKGGQSSGVATGISESVQFLAKNFVQLSQGIEIAVSGYIAYKAAAIGAEIATLALNGALLKNPIGAVVTALGLATGALFTFREEAVKVGESQVTVGSLVETVWDNIKEKINTATQAIDDFWLKHSTLAKMNNFMLNLPTPLTVINNAFNGDDPIISKKISDQAQLRDLLKENEEFEKKGANDYKIWELNSGLKTIKPKVSVLFDSDKFQKDADSAAQKMTKELSDKFERIGEKYKVPADILKAIGIVESKLQNGLTSSAGAVGMMQVKPANKGGANLGFSESQLKDETTSIEAAAKLLDNLYAKYRNWETVIALYHEGETKKTLKNLKENNGVLNQALLSLEGREYSPKVEIALKSLNSSLSDTTKGYKQVEQAAKKSLHEQEKAAQDTYNFSKKIAKDEDDIQKEISGNIKKGLAEHKSLLDAIATPEQKFMSSIERYTTGFNDGEFSLEQYTQAIARFQDQLNKPIDNQLKKYAEENTKAFDAEREGIQQLMRDLTMSDADKFIGDLRGKKTSDGKQALYSDEQIKQLSDLRDKWEVTKLQDDIGLSMRAISSSFGTMFSNVLTKGMSFTTALRDMFKNTMTKISDGLMNFGMTSMMSGNFLAGFASMAGSVVVGLLQSVFKGKVTDLTTPETALTGSVLGSDSASNSIKNIVDTLNSIHATEYRELVSLNDNFKNLVESTTKGTALALRDMGGVKYSMKGMNGQSSNTGASEKGFLMGLGTTAISAGLAGAGMGTGLAVAALDAAAISLATTMGSAGSTIATGMVSLGTTLASGGLAAAAAMGGIGLLIGGAIYGLSKLLGIGKVKFEAVGGGIITNAQNFVLDGMQQAVAVYDYSKIKKTVTGWFSDDVTYFDVINGMNNPLTKLFTGVFAQVEGSILEASKVLNVESLINKDITLAKMKLSLKKGDKYTEENQKKIEDAINKATDDIASQALGRYFSAFQKLGEGMAETTARLASQAVVAKSGFEKLGMTVKLSGLGLVSFSDSLANAMGGLKEMQSAFDDIYNAFTSDSQKLIDAKKATQDFMDALKIPAEKGIPKSITTDADALKVVDYLKGSLESVSTVLGGFKSATNAKPENDIDKTLKDFAGYFSGATKNTLLGLGKDITTESLKAALVGSGKSLAGEIEGTKAINVKMWQGLLDYAKANSDFKSSQTQFDKARWESPELAKLVNDLGFALPDTIDGVQKFVAGLEVVNDSIAKNINQFSGLTKTIKLVTSEQEKMIETLKKSISGFKDSIEKWVLNKQITQLGTPETQLKIAQDDFNKTLGILRNSSSTPEQLTQAMSDITGSADAYISKIEQMYAHGETGANLIEGVVNSVKNLPKTVSLQQQTVDLLTKIRDGVYEIPSGMELLFERFGVAKAEYEKNPTGKNQLTFDAYTKMILTLDNAYKNGVDGAILSRMIDAVVSEKGLEASIKVVLDQSNLTLMQKEGVINNLINGFDDTLLSIKQVQLDFDGKELQDRLDLIVASYGQLTSNVYTIFEIDVPLKNVNDAISAANTLIDSQVAISNIISDVKIDISDVHLAILKTEELIANQFESLSIAGLVKIDYTQAYLGVLGMIELVSWQNTSTSIDGKVSVNNQDVFNANLGLTDLVSKQTESMAINGAINIDSSQINSAISSMRELLALQQAGTATPPPVTSPVTSPVVTEKTRDSAYGSSWLEGEATNYGNGFSGDFTDTQGMLKSLGLSGMDEFDSYMDKKLGKNIVSDSIATPAPIAPLVVSPVSSRPTIYSFDGFEGYAVHRAGYSGDYTNFDAMLNQIKVAGLKHPIYSGELLSYGEFINANDGYYGETYQKFAKGGISNVPAIFGEAGAEAAVPLPDGRSIPVTLNRPAANDSNVDTAELVAELKESNRQLQEQNRQLAALIALNQATLKENQSQTTASQTTAAKIRIGARS